MCLCIVWAMCVQVPTEARIGPRSPGAKVTGGCERKGNREGREGEGGGKGGREREKENKFFNGKAGPGEVGETVCRLR